MNAPARVQNPAQYAAHAEQTVIGVLLRDNQALASVADLPANDFVGRNHRLIFSAIKTLSRKNKPADVITVSEQLEENGELEDAGGLAYIGTLANDSAGSAGNIAAYAEIVRKYGQERRLLTTIEQASNAAHAGDFKEAERLFHLDRVSQTSEQKVSGPEWPAPPDTAAFHGIAGEIVRAIEPHTESDPAAILIQLLIAAGNFLNRGPYFQVEADLHYTNLFAVIVGDTSKGRKGTAWGRTRAVFEKITDIEGVADTWTQERIMSGLSSGEGLIWSVRDPIIREEGGKKTIDDDGIHDKRLLVIESEFASTLRVMERDGNTLSALIRQCWDRGDLRTMTKNSAAVATGAHISIVGHITADELRRYLTRTESGNGFANRFLFICTRRSKVLPEGGADVDMADYARRLAQIVGRARALKRVCLDSEARAMWAKVYPDLSNGKPGLLGAVTSRAEAQTVRLALIYAVLDGSDQIQPAHLRAALAVWTYAEASARFVFGDQVGDPVVDELYRAIRTAGAAGITTTDAHNLFKRHRGKEQIGAAFDTLIRLGRAVSKQVGTAGRPAQVFIASDLNSLSSLNSHQGAA